MSKDKNVLEAEWESLAEEARRVESGRIRLEADLERYQTELAEEMDKFEKEFGTRDLEKIEEILLAREARAEEVLKNWREAIERSKSEGRELQAKLAELK